MCLTVFAQAVDLSHFGAGYRIKDIKPGEVILTRDYEADEVNQNLSTPESQKFLEDVRAKIASQPPEKTKYFTDTEIAFRWGVDWVGLSEHIQMEQYRQALAAITDPKSRGFIDRFESTRIKKARELKEKTALPEGSTAIDNDLIKDQILKYHLDRLTELNRSLPGFISWLFEGLFRTKWALVDGPFTEDFCKNSQIYKLEQKVVACQVPGLTKYLKTWFQSMESNAKARSEIFLHELIRYKIMALASTTFITQQEQDALTARISQAFLNPAVKPDMFYDLLRSAHLVVKDSDIDHLRQYEIAHSIGIKIYQLESLIDLITTCGTKGYEMDHIVLPFIDRIIDNIVDCRRYVSPDDSELYCELKTLVFQMHNYRTQCFRPFPEHLRRK